MRMMNPQKNKNESSKDNEQTQHKTNWDSSPLVPEIDEIPF